MSGRKNAFEFADEALTSFEPNVRKPVDRAAIEAVSLAEGFPSRAENSGKTDKPRLEHRKASEAGSSRADHRYRSGRNVQMNIKTTQETRDLFYAEVERRQLKVVEAFEECVAAWIEQSRKARK